VNTPDALFTLAGQAASFTFNRPGSGNALTWAMYDALTDACERVDAADGIRTFIIRGAGGIFSTGTDIGQFTAFRSGADGLAYERRLEACLNRLESVSVPTIAVIDGPAAGAGFAIALACDLRVCSSTARFGVPIARTLGNALSIENCARLVEHLGPSRTKDLLITGRLLDAAEAGTMGLVNQVVDPVALENTVNELVDRITRNAPHTIRAAKEALRRLSRGSRLDSDSGSGFDAYVAACYESLDFREGVAAFLGKRPPRFGQKGEEE
jgi:enoyl-CoA hydratase